jgi:hypothetical protein
MVRDMYECGLEAPPALPVGFIMQPGEIEGFAVRPRNEEGGRRAGSAELDRRAFPAGSARGNSAQVSAVPDEILSLKCPQNFKTEGALILVVVVVVNVSTP